MAALNLRSCSRWVVFSCVSSLLSLGAPHPAAAEKGRSAPRPAPERDPNVLTDEADADVLASKASVARQANRLLEAADLYGKAWETYKAPKYICNQGFVLLEAGRHREAAERLYACSKLPPSSDRAVNGRVDTLLEKARSEICTLSLSTNVPRAVFLVDGHLVGTEPKREPIFVEAGDPTVVAKAQGYASAVSTGPCGKGDWIAVNLRMEPALKPGQVMSAPRPAADSPALGSTDREPLFKGSDFASPGAAAPRSTGNTVMLIAGTTVAVASAGLAIGSFLASSAKTAEADDIESAILAQDPSKACKGLSRAVECQIVDSNRGSAALFTALGIGSSILSAGGIALTVYAVVDGSSSTQQTTARVSLRVAPDGGALSLVGRF